MLDLGIRRWAGKLQSELAMLRDMISELNCGDVLLTDRYLCSYMEIALLQQRGVDFVGRMHARRMVDFRGGKQLGRYDHVVQWIKPQRPAWMSKSQYATIPETLSMREFRCCVIRPGYRPRTITVATTLLDDAQYSVAEIADLYRLRWDAESSFAENDDAHGRASLPDARDGSIRVGGLAVVGGQLGTRAVYRPRPKDRAAG